MPPKVPSTSYWHLLVGPPASGKSTLAAQLQCLIPNAVIISTDRLRQQLYGDAVIQGPWPEIAAAALREMQRAHGHNQAVIYDATNVQRPWRLAVLAQAAPFAVCWVAWVLTTPLATCLAWNQQRQRQVPTAVIEGYYHALQTTPVTPAEGYAAIYRISPTLPIADLCQHVQQSCARLAAKVDP